MQSTCQRSECFFNNTQTAGKKHEMVQASSRRYAASRCSLHFEAIKTKQPLRNARWDANGAKER